ncbi:hypothetical protein GCM10009665_60360 [Kitasatospora nipponensis]|uniref:Uncharacterized protein n=1 Tax=Kitasatospora nipponensis TaxID=258049 RepID=A0ABP4HEV1_9ACTN
MHQVTGEGEQLARLVAGQLAIHGLGGCGVHEGGSPPDRGPGVSGAALGWVTTRDRVAVNGRSHLAMRVCPILARSSRPTRAAPVRVDGCDLGLRPV